LLIGLAPERVAAVQMKRGLRPVLGVDVVRECAGVSDDASAETWAGALTALDELLEGLGPVTGVASVVLSSRFVRYGQLPWTEGVFAEEDRQALAAGCFRAVHGEAVDHWRVAVGAPRYGCDNLAVAVDAALLDGLREILARRRLRLVAVRPHLTAAFDRWRSQLLADDGGFVLVEPGCITTLFRRGGQWAEVANRRYRIAHEAVQIIRQCIDADHVRGGEGGVVVLAPGMALEKETGNDGFPRCLTGLGGPWPDDPWRSMAWSAA
jgi:hypothetical protein